MKKITIRNTATASDLVGMGILQPVKARKSIKTGWLTLAQYLTLQNLSATHGERVLLGLELNKLARLQGLRLPERQPGFASVYPVSLLATVTKLSKV